MKITPLPQDIPVIGLGMTLADGDILTWDAPTGTWMAGSPSADPGLMTLFLAARTPYYIAPAETYTVPLYKQTLFEELIEVDAGGTLTIDGYLIMVT